MREAERFVEANTTLVELLPSYGWKSEPLFFKLIKNMIAET
jgi:hypothetical protein